MSEKGIVQCRHEGCEETIDLEGLNVKEIKQKLSENNWSAVYHTTACPEHNYENQV